MITLRELLDIAIDHLQTFTAKEKPDFRLEQAEYKEEQQLWDVVVSWLVKRYDEGGPALIRDQGYYLRIWKRIHIDKEKQVVDMWFFGEEAYRLQTMNETGSAQK